MGRLSMTKKIVTYTKAVKNGECPQCHVNREALIEDMKAPSGSESFTQACRIIENCITCGTALYQLYRRRTGQCELCFSSVLNHPKCDACDEWCGLRHVSKLIPFRGKKLCSPCVKNWLDFDKEINRQSTFDEFKLKGKEK